MNFRPAVIVYVILTLSWIFSLSAQTAVNTAPTSLTNGSPTASVNYSSGSSLTVRSTSGRFPLVAAGLSETITLQLRFALNSNAGLTIQSLDGATVVSPANSSVSADGTASVQLQMGGRPGLYRFLINQGGIISLVQFWVPDPQSPDNGPPAIQPSTGI